MEMLLNFIMLRHLNKAITTKLTQLHPVITLLYLTGVLLCYFFNFSLPTSALIIFELFIILCFLTGFSNTIKLIFFSLLMSLFIMPIKILTYTGGHKVLLYINDYPITLEAIYAAISSGLLILFMILFFRLLSLILTKNKFIFLFGKCFPSTTLIAIMIMTFTSRYKESYQAVALSQETLGLKSSKGFVNKIKITTAILSGFIGYMLENSLDSAASMRCRGYSRRLHVHNRYYLGFHDIVIIIIACMTATVFLMEQYLGVFTYICNPLKIIYIWLPLILYTLQHISSERSKHDKCQ